MSKPSAQGNTIGDWTDPGPHAVAPGVHRIPLPLPLDGLRCVNVYAIEDSGGVALVDAGMAIASSRKQLESALAELGFDLGSITQLLITHVHIDHLQLATVLRKELGTRVHLGVAERLSMTELVEGSGNWPYLTTRLREAGATNIAEWFEGTLQSGPGEEYDSRGIPDSWLIDGQSIALSSRSLRVLHTPGHTRGHVVFMDEDHDLIFSGDHVLPHITPSIGFEPVPGVSPLKAYLASLALVRTLSDSTLLPAHGPTMSRTHARIDELIAHHEIRLDLTEDAISTGVDTAAQAAERITWTKKAVRFDTLDPFNQLLAVNETMSHLDVLVGQHRLSSELDSTAVRRYWK